MIRRPLYIFDLDGTIADISHRRHIIEEPGKNDDKWRRFYAAFVDDKPNRSVLFTLNTLYVSGADIWIFSGRSDEVREVTEDWLCDHTIFSKYYLNTALMMRQAGDYTPDDVLKERWLNNMLDADRKRLVAVFDDRKRVVDMWRRNGIPCFQVADGDF